MRQEDFIIREIQRLGDFILALMGKLKRKEVQQQDLNDLIQKKFPLSLEEILLTPKENFKDVFTKECGFNISNIEHLADLLSMLDEESAKVKALELLLYCNETDRTFSIIRDAKIQDLQASIPN